LSSGLLHELNNSMYLIQGFTKQIKEHQAKLLNDKLSTKSDDGNGIGLNLSKKIIEHEHGRSNRV
jgi:light-regulated signal transduction histidine kinase (bacteriophytochrome)